MMKQKIVLILFLALLSTIAFAAKLNINTADIDQLAEGMVGVGAGKAQAIIAYREQNGPFGSVDELEAVKGISGKTIERNRKNITARSR